VSESVEPSRAADQHEAAREAVRQRFVPEVRTALNSAADVRAWPRDWDERGEVDYFYRSGSLLARDHDVPRVRDTLQTLGALPEDDPANEAPSPETDDIALINGVRRLVAHVRPSQHTADVVKDLDARLGIGVATHEHVFAVAYVAVCPATEPEPVFPQGQVIDPAIVEAALWPPPSQPTAGTDISVSVVDTGLLDGADRWAPWLAGVHPDSAADLENPDQLELDAQNRDRTGYADPYAAHGTFVSGVVRCVAPASNIVVERILDHAGFARESSLIKQIHDGLSRSPDIITMSAGGYTRNNVPPLSFETLWNQRLSQLGGLVLVAAAGNNATARPFWPAAFPWCIGVGSMSRDGQRRSWFSNHGSWVDVYAPGEDIINAYAQMKYKTIVDAEVRDTSAGIVKWSGTSFSTPIVAGLIAARMSRTGETGRDAAAALLQAARGQFRPTVGSRLFP
jgi:hypothetical protein